MLKNKINTLKIYVQEKSRLPYVKNIFIVGSITLILKIFGFYKETFVAANFGLSALLDAFYIAILIPSFIQNVFLVSIKNIFIPNYVREIAQKNNAKNGSFFSLVFLLIIAIVILFTLITLLFDRYFLEQVFRNHNTHFYTLVRKQLYILLPCLFFWGCSSLLSGLLDIHDKFIYSSVYLIFIPVCIIAALAFFKSAFPETLLAVGTLAGSFLGFVFLLFATSRFRLIQIKKPKLNGNSAVMIKQLPPKIISSFLTGINQFVDQFFAAQLVIGSISALNYGTKIPSLVLSLSMIAMGNVLLPHFSKKTAENKLAAFKELFKILKVLFVSALFFATALIVFSPSIISFLFERKAFTPENTAIVAHIQQIILIYVPFYLCGNLLGKFLTSINKNSFMAWVSLYNLAANIILNIVFVKIYGVYGLVISTSIVLIVSSFVYFYFTYRQYKKLIISEQVNI